MYEALTTFEAILHDEPYSERFIKLGFVDHETFAICNCQFAKHIRERLQMTDLKLHGPEIEISIQRFREIFNESSKFAAALELPPEQKLLKMQEILQETEILIAEMKTHRLAVQSAFDSELEKQNSKMREELAENDRKYKVKLQPESAPKLNQQQKAIAGTVKVMRSLGKSDEEIAKMLNLHIDSVNEIS